MKVEKGNLEKLILQRNAKIKELKREVILLRDQNESLKSLLRKLGWDSSWFDSNFRKLEREVHVVRRLIDLKRDEHKNIEGKIKDLDNRLTKEENKKCMKTS